MPASSVCSPTINAVTWLVIPKGVQGGKFRFTVMAAFDQKTFVPHGPFASDGSCNGNWCTWIRDALVSFIVCGSSGWKKEVGVKSIPKVADKIWTRTFQDATKTMSPATDELTAVAARATALIRDCTSVSVRASEQTALLSVALQLSMPAPAVAPGWIEATTIDHLFPEGPPVAAGMGLTATELDLARRDYAAFAECFLPVSPSLRERNGARVAKESLQPGSLADAEGQLLQHLETVYSPGFGADFKAKSEYTDQPIFSEWAASQLRVAVGELKPAGVPDLTALATDNGDAWAMSALKHLISTVPYVPTSEQEGKAKATRRSGQNLLAALMAEPGLLGSLGLLFDLEVETKTVDSEVWVEPQWKAGKAPCFDSQSRRTVTEQGFAKLRGDVAAFDATGFLKLGLGAGTTPQFKLSDFRFDEAFRQAQHRAQSERNLQPQHSPGANRTLQPTMELVDFQSHDLALHWVQRPDLAQKRRQPVAASTSPLYLEDLVAGIRPMLGRVDGSDRIAWFDLTRKNVQYGALEGAARSDGDRARDGSMVPLVSFDRRTQEVSSVAELLCTWNGWAIGLGLPGASNDSSAFNKMEAAAPRSLPAFRYGQRVCMAARLVLRDGSCLLDAESAAAQLGTSWNAQNERVIGDALEDAPFHLHRWERLRAPLVLLDAVPKRGSWWPADSATQVILATGLAHGGPNRSKTIRYLVPARETDMFSTWKHGAFDGKTLPTATAFGDIAVDGERQESFASAVAEDGTPITLFKSRGLTGARRKAPYHPDPMVTHFVVTLVRRRHAKSDQLVPVVDEHGDVICVVVDIYGKEKWPNARALRAEIVSVPREQRKRVLELTDSGSTMIVRVPEGESFSLLIFPDGDPEVLREKHAFGEERLAKALGRAKYVHAAARVAGIRTALTGKGAQVPTHLPFLANATVIDIEHLLDRPFLRPQLSVTKTSDRAVDETSQRYHAEITFDPGSTSAVEVYGSWIEPEGNIARILKGARQPSFPHLIGTLEHGGMGKEFLDGHVEATPAIRPTQKATLELVHETHDWKHRKIAYWSRGISNAASRQEGDPPPDSPFAHPRLAVGHDEALHQLSVGTTQVVHLRASRKPKPIEYRYLVPAFRLSTETADDQIRRRRSSVCALHMDGDWFSSGADEALAVILIDPQVVANAHFPTLQDRFEALQAQYAQVATFWGADPLKQGEGAPTRLPDFVDPGHFPDGTRMAKYRWHASAGDVGLPVMLALFEPEVCEGEKSWRVEIPLVNPSAVSRPMVRFAFARYQPHALDKLGISQIHLADYAQLSNDREVVIARDSKDDKKLHVTVYGVSFDGSEDSGEARLSCWLERRCAKQVDGEAAWVDEGGLPEPWQRTTREGRACWHGVLIADESLRNSRYRVAITEEERYRRDLSSVEHGSIPVYFDLIPVNQIG